MRTNTTRLLVVWLLVGVSDMSMAYTTDVASLVVSLTNQGAQLYLSPSQVASTFAISASNVDSEWQFNLTASDGTNAYTFYYGTPSSTAVLRAVSRVAPNGSGFRFTYRDDGGIGAYADALSNRIHGVEVVFYGGGVPRSLVHYVTNAVVGEEIYWNVDGSLADEFVRTNPVPIQVLFGVDPP